MTVKTGRDLLKAAKLRASALEPEEVDRIVRAANGHAPTLLDVRENDEWRAGHLPGAVHLSRSWFELQVDEKLPDKDAPIIVYCAGGNRSASQASTFRIHGPVSSRPQSE